MDEWPWKSGENVGNKGKNVAEAEKVVFIGGVGRYSRFWKSVSIGSRVNY